LTTLGNADDDLLLAEKDKQISELKQ